MALPQGPLRFSAVLVAGVALGWGVATLTAPPVASTSAPLGGATANAAMTRAGGGKKGAKSGIGSSGYGMDDEFTSMLGSPGAKPDDLLGAFRSAVAANDYIDAGLRLREIARTLRVEDIPDAFEKARKLPFNEQWRVIGELARRYAELDLKGAIAFAQKNKIASRYDNENPFLTGVIAYWARQSPDEALAWVNALPGSRQRRDLFNNLASSVANTNPELALRLFKQNQRTNQGTWQTENLFSTWSGKDPEAAEAALADLRGNMLRGAVQGIAREMATKDPKQALEWAASVKDTLASKNAIQTIADEWSLQDPVAVIAWTETVKDEEMQRNIRATAISRLAQLDVNAALSQIEKLPEGEHRDQMVFSAAQVLANTDSRKALELLQDMPDTLDKKRALSRVCAEWASTEPREALDWLYKHSTPAMDDYSMRGLFAGWADQNPEEALEWAEGLKNADQRDSALASIVAAFSSSEPARAQEIFGKLSPDAQATAAPNMAYALLNEDFTKALSWAEALPPGKAQANVMNTVATRYFYKDNAAAARWVQTLPAGIGRDRAVAGYANAAVNKDPEGAIAWALTISDERDRNQTVEGLAKRWMGTDRTAGRRWVENSAQLTPEQKQRILDR